MTDWLAVSLQEFPLYRPIRESVNAVTSEIQVPPGKAAKVAVPHFTGGASCQNGSPKSVAVNRRLIGLQRVRCKACARKELRVLVGARSVVGTDFAC